MIVELVATRWRMRELIRARELASSHKLEQMRRVRMLEEQAAWKRETSPLRAMIRNLLILDCTTLDGRPQRARFPIDPINCNVAILHKSRRIYLPISPRFSPYELQYNRDANQVLLLTISTSIHVLAQSAAETYTKNKNPALTRIELTTPAIEGCARLPLISIFDFDSSHLTYCPCNLRNYGDTMSQP